MSEQESETTMELEELKSLVGSKFGSIADIKVLLQEYLERKNIDLISRIRDVELDKICSMLYHTHNISLKMSLLVNANRDKTKEKDLKIIMCSGENYVLQNLYLRLSLNSQSRIEIENILVSLIKKEMEQKESEQGTE